MGDIAYDVREEVHMVKNGRREDFNLPIPNWDALPSKAIRPFINLCLDIPDNLFISTPAHPARISLTDLWQIELIGGIFLLWKGLL